VTYTNLPPHQKIYLSVVFLFLGDWDSDDSLSIEIDNNPPFSIQVHPNQPSKKPFCWKSTTTTTPTTEPAQGLEFILELPHSTSKIALKFSSYTSPTRMTALAFNNVKIYLDSTPVDTTSTTYYVCNINNPERGCPLPNQPLWQGSFCDNQKIFDSVSGVCEMCAGAPFCTYCTSQAACADCKSGSLVDKNTQCGVPCSIESCDKCEQTQDGGQVCKLCSNSFVLFDGICYSQCPDESYIVKGMSDQERECIDKCPAGKYNAWNFTCIDDCPFPFIKKHTLHQGQICEFPCNRNVEYLYLNGSCLKTCPEESLNSEGNQGFQLCNIGSNIVNAIINEQNVSLTIDAISMHPYKSSIQNVGGKLPSSFKIETTWTFFSVDEEDYDLYTIQNWDSDVKCGCQPKLCGRDCDPGYFCDDSRGGNKNAYDLKCWIPFLDHVSSHPKFCYNLYTKGNETFKAYKIQPFSSISLVNYGGPGITTINDDDFSGWFTITDKINNQSFAMNAMIIHSETKKIFQDFRYAPSENRVVLKQQLLEMYNQTPHVEVFWNESKCDSDGAYLSRKINLPTSEVNKLEEKNIFSYQILAQAQVPEFTSLEDVFILTPSSGVRRWKMSQSTNGFHYLDPCNQQFLTLEFNHLNGNYMVRPPGQQKLNDHKYLCIVVAESLDWDDDTRGLVLYELLNGTDIWRRSTRFTGILTNDYLSQVTLLVTTNSSIPLNSTEDDDHSVSIAINHGTSQPRISLKTNYPMVCDIYISRECTFRITTTKEGLTGFKQIPQHCGKWYERPAYQCNGLLGYLHPPNALVSKKIKDFMIPRIVRTRQDLEVTPLGSQEENPSFWKYFLTFTIILVVMLVTGYFSYQHHQKEKRNKIIKENDVTFDENGGIFFSFFKENFFRNKNRFLK